MTFKLDSTKKKIAFEVLVLIIATTISILVYFIGEKINDIKFENKYKQERLLNSKIESLENNSFKRNYNYLSNNQSQLLRFDSYWAYKKKILNDFDTSFRKSLYTEICSLDLKYRNDVSFDEFINLFEYSKINEIDEQIESLKNEKSALESKSITESDTHISIIIFLLIFIYPVRILYLIASWSIKTIRGNNLKEDVVVQNNGLKHENTPDKNITVNKIPILNYFSFNDEYVSGNMYFLRMLISSLLLFIIIGFLLMPATIYKRSISLGFKKNKAIVTSIVIPVFIFIASIINILELTPENYIENDYQFYFFTLLVYLLLSPHLLLWFKNGTRKSNKL